MDPILYLIAITADGVSSDGPFPNEEDRTQAVINLDLTSDADLVFVDIDTGGGISAYAMSPDDFSSEDELD